MDSMALANIEKQVGCIQPDVIEILPGSGVNASNLAELVKKTGVHQAHSSCRYWENDPTTTGTDVSYAYHDDYDYDCVSEELVKKLVDVSKTL